MQLETFQYIEKKGWSIDSFPNLDSENTLVLIFASPIFLQNPAPLKELSLKYPNSKIIGCSSAGEICGAGIFDNSISVAVVKLEKTQLHLTSISIKSSLDSYNAGVKIVDKLKKDDLRGILVLSDGLNINGSELVRGLNSANIKDLVITGGLAADGSAFKETWIFVNSELIPNSIAAVGFYGSFISIGYGSCGGWDIFGPERRITRSKGNTLYELDSKPALNLYKEYLGEKAAGLPATGLLFPLAIRKDNDSKKQLVRTILAVDEASNALIFAGDMPMGYLAQLMRANFDRLIAGADQAGKIALASKRDLTNKPFLSIAISCVGRRLLLGERTEEETETLLKLFPAQTQQIGFYSYGELSPDGQGDCDLHNQTMTITTIREEAE